MSTTQSWVVRPTLQSFLKRRPTNSWLLLPTWPIIIFRIEKKFPLSIAMTAARFLENVLVNFDGSISEDEKERLVELLEPTRVIHHDPPLFFFVSRTRTLQ